MRLAPFLRSNAGQISREWERYAQTLIPASEHMSPRALRDHIEEILDFIANDIDASQTKSEQAQKAYGEKPGAWKDSAAEIHASLRQAGGFSLNQMVSEFRALRASVTKLWEEQAVKEVDGISELVRFNEAIDQVLTESIAIYTDKLAHSRDLFLGIISHDLRNPIGAMRMSAQLALHIGPLSERQTMLVSQVISSGARAIEILDHLLDLTRARLGSGLPIIRKHGDIAFLSRQIVEEMRALHPDRTITLQISGNTEGHWDRPRLGQVFSNLLGNALQYGFTDLPIVVTVTGDTEQVCVSVHNDGVPIAPNLIGGIFNSLTRGEPQHSEKHADSTNLGLGLFIVKEIVSAHGGTISVASSEKDGTIFVARFPRSAEKLDLIT